MSPAAMLLSAAGDQFQMISGRSSRITVCGGNGFYFA